MTCYDLRMAQRRMFSLKIVDSDAFLEMPVSTQLLYFHLSMRADDDGFVGNPKKIMRVVGCGDDDFKILKAKRFVFIFDSGVIVIKHWRIHNLIQGDRYSETEYKEEKRALNLNENGAYTDRQDGTTPVDVIQKPSWQQKRIVAMRESTLPQSFDYKIRHAFHGELCPICGVKMSEKLVSDIKYGECSNPSPSIQHIIPISKGGKHELENIAVICMSCNSSVRNTTTVRLNADMVEEVWKQIGNTSVTQVRLGKDRIDRRVFGSEKNVFLSDNELKDLRTRYGNSAVSKLIEDLSVYMASKGKRYKSHKATILNWARRGGIVEQKPLVVAPIVKEEVSPEEQAKIRARLNAFGSKLRKVK